MHALMYPAGRVFRGKDSPPTGSRDATRRESLRLRLATPRLFNQNRNHFQPGIRTGVFMRAAPNECRPAFFQADISNEEGFVALKHSRFRGSPLSGQRPEASQPRAKRGTSAALGYRFKRASALKGRDRAVNCFLAPIGARSFSDPIPRATLSLCPGLASFRPLA
jgi:hypothetical protein